jgi:hypothetical protein
MDGEEFRTVRYVTQDPIQNLRIRVTLTRLSAQRGGKANIAQQVGRPGLLTTTDMTCRLLE